MGEPPVTAAAEHADVSVSVGLQSVPSPSAPAAPRSAASLSATPAEARPRPPTARGWQPGLRGYDPDDKEWYRLDPVRPTRRP
jgi:hypothetical protein